MREKVKKGKRGKVIVVLFLGLALLSTCSRTPVPSQSGEMRQVVDDLGRSVSVPVKIERAVSLAPSLTEMIFAVGAGDRLVGVTTYCNYPEEAKAIQKVGDTMTPNIESIIALKPDVVFISTDSQLEAFMGTLRDQRIAVYVTDPKSVDEVIKAMSQLAVVLGLKDKTERWYGELVGRVDIARASVKDGRPMPKVFVQISNDPLFTIGKESFLTGIVRDAGGISVTKDVPTAYPKLSKETALALDPDVIILSDSDDNKEPNAVFKNSPAVKNGRVYRINADIISRPGPRLVDAIEEIAKALHRSE